ncbi:MAG: DUF1684 domain-containing protein [Gammaproteobacteria bacterium]|nr:MAG: DUF1684 domain-containing protein [Gammaproteobacteria bacterium]
MNFGNLLMSAVILTSLGAAAADNDDAWRKEIGDWRTARLERLKSPYGWPSLIGLEWLKQGANTVGSANDNAIVIAKAPAHLGTITLQDGKATIAIDAKADATIDGEKKTSTTPVDDSQPKPTQIGFGTVKFYLIQRGDKFGLRIKDSEAATRQKMIAQGVENFELDPSWRIEAKWEAYNPPHEVEGVNIIGQTEKYVMPGAATFERGGKTYKLEPMIENPGDTELFLVFADRTSGKETYGAARFVYAAMPKDGKVVLDFNKAYNPPCAFTPYATCPLPTPQNRLDLRVTAGEKKWKGGHEGT